jgi:hypothetical protein
LQRRWRCGGVAEGRQGRQSRAIVPRHARRTRCWWRWCPPAGARCPRRTRCWRRSCASKVGEVDALVLAGCERLRAGLERATATGVRGAGTCHRDGRLASATGEGARAGGGHGG